MKASIVALALLLAGGACEYRPTMPLPESREETATPASPVSSNTINAIQDQIIGKLGDQHSVSFPMTPYNVADGAGVVTFVNGTAHYSGATNGAYFTFPLEAKRTLVGFGVSVNSGGGTADVSLNLLITPGSLTALSPNPTLLNIADPTSEQEYVLDVPYVVQPHEYLELRPIAINDDFNILSFTLFYLPG